MKWNELAKKRMPAHNQLESWEIRHIYRKLSLPFTYVLYHLGFSANMVSYLMIVVSLLSAYMIMAGHPIIGVLLWQVWLVLDSTDGEIARLRGTLCAAGWFLDLIFENICFTLNFIAIGYFTGMPLFGWIIGLMWVICITIRYNYFECLSITNYEDETLWNKPELDLFKLAKYVSYGEFKNPIAWAAIIFAVFGGLHIFIILACVGMVMRFAMQCMVLYTGLKVAQ